MVMLNNLRYTIMITFSEDRHCAAVQVFAADVMQKNNRLGLLAFKYIYNMYEPI